MEKYNLLPEQLIYEGTIKESNLFKPEEISRTIAERTHTSTYLDKLEHLSLSDSEIRKTGFPLSKELIIREKLIMQGTVEATKFALKHGAGMNIAGGTHHAFTDRGEGFCLMNDIGIAANWLLDHTPIKNILVVDLDVHQGNGTAQIFLGEERVFTFSMHGKKNYPFHKERSDLDIELEDGMDDKTYLSILEKNLYPLFEKLDPDFVFYQCGVDILASDKLGKLGLSHNGCKERDKMVITMAHEANIPLCGSMGGGYSEKLTDIIEAHANTYRLVQEIYY